MRTVTLIDTGALGTRAKGYTPIALTLCPVDITSKPGEIIYRRF